MSEFQGESLDQNAVLVRYVYSGDANLDGTISTGDFTQLAQHFNGSSNVFWQDGDFNYDGNVNALDFNALATNFGSTLPAAAPALGALVPEPAVISLLAVTGVALWRRRRVH